MTADKRHIALIGFMGAGKTSVGFELARLLERPFVDVDVELEQRHGLTIAEMFEQRGEPWFRNAESELTRSALEAAEPSVLALGGGAVKTPETRRGTRAARAHGSRGDRRRRGLAAGVGDEPAARP